MSYSSIKTKCDEFGLPVWWARKKRTLFLRERFTYWMLAYLQTFEYEPAQIWKEAQMTAIEHCRREALKRVKKYNALLHALERPERPGQITEEDKKVARNIDCRTLVEVNRHDMLKCLWHDDNKASARVGRNGKIRCFVCNRQFDAIDVLMVRGMSFVDAVKELRQDGT